jgi:putative chitinase
MLLKLGSQGEDVIKLQIKLGVDPIGKFGPKTETAVKEWQAANGMTADGIVGDGTWSKLFSESTVSTPVIITEPAPVISVGGLKLEKLRGHIPDSVISQIPDTASKFGIDTPIKLAHFLSQCGHESGGFKITQENLNYSAKGLRGIFGKYFPTDTLAESYQRNPQKIANKVYSSRMGNGDENSGDGYKFRGRGYIQLTGRDNYTAFGKSINEDIANNPDLVSTKYPLLSAAWFFSKNCLKKCVDASDQTVTSVTKCVNGGTIGLSERIKEFKHFYTLLS